MTAAEPSNELPSTSKPMPNAYEITTDGIVLIVQFSWDDGYYGFGFVEETNEEIARVGPTKELKQCLGKLGKEVRKAGYWQE